SISISWTGAGSLEGGVGRLTVDLTGVQFEITKISDTLSIGPLVTVSMAESLGYDYTEPPASNGIAYFDHAMAFEYCDGSGGEMLNGVGIEELAAWMGEPENVKDEEYKLGVGYILNGQSYGNVNWYIGGRRAPESSVDGDRPAVFGHHSNATQARLATLQDDHLVALVCAYD
ncbi:hypothetical protein ACP45E_02950, partial [Vibrio genomosp. F10 str. 9ZD137]